MFHYLADELIHCVNNDTPEFRLPFLEDYGFTWVSYDGTQARNNVRNPKQGLFDIFIDTGDRYGNVTHRDILTDVLEHDLREESRQIWMGVNPQDITFDEDELEILTTLALLMFEQEVNWGRREIEWQRPTPYFYPYKRGRVNERRPRDQLMAYIDWLFEVQEIEDLEFWLDRTGRTTLSPSDPTDRFSGLHPTLEEITDGYDEAGGPPLMVGEYFDLFEELADRFDNNPHYSE